MIKVPKIRLNDNHLIPMMGHGIAVKGRPIGGLPKVSKASVVKGLKNALKEGHRLIDTAKYYDYDVEIGKVIKESQIKRKEIFITSKVWPDIMDNEEKMDSWIKKSLRDLQITYFDLLLLHFPLSSKKNINSWKILEKYKEQGIVKSIGVSNFESYDLEQLLFKCKTKPAINQVEASLLFFNHLQYQICNLNDIQMQGYSPLGRGFLQKGRVNNAFLRNAIIKEAKKFNLTEYQIMLLFLLGKGVIPIVKANTLAHIRENLAIFKKIEIAIVIVKNLALFTGRQRISGNPDASFMKEFYS